VSGYNQPVGCCACGFKDIRPSDTYCQKCGAELCDEAKKPANSDLEKSALQKENRELKNQLAEVKNQLVKLLAELKKLRNSSTGQNNAELDQQIDLNEKLIRHSEEVPEAEVKEQVKKSQALLEKASFGVVPTKDDPGSGFLPYVIGGAVLVSAMSVIGYYL